VFPFSRGIFQSRLIMRLCAALMSLVAVTLAFLWIVQIVFFEPSYIETIGSEIEEQALLLANDLHDADEVSLWNNPLRNFSRTINGKVYLADEAGEIVYSFSSGIPGQTDYAGVKRVESWYIEKLFIPVCAGEKTTLLLDKGTSDFSLSVGIPVQYQGKPAALFITHSLSAARAVLELNRKQLTVLSVILPVLAVILSLLLARALQKVDTLQKEIIANVSHELRAPLSLITGYTEMVRDITWKDETQKTENLNLILREANRLSLMVDDIMDYSQFHAGCTALHKTPTNLYEIITSEIDYSTKAAASYNIDIALSSFDGRATLPITVNIDGLKMSQVLRNLLNNAINHTEDGGTIGIHISKNESTIKVSVTNHGDPIPREERAAIWERYHKVQHQAGRREGTGIGLAIVSTILKAHGFKYGVVSENGLNTFWFSIGGKNVRTNE
jgi:signal transduction histidine kinase